MRFEDTPDLFGRGAGSSTGAEIKCEFCGTVHNKGMSGGGSDEGDSVCNTTFGGMQVCDCCFEKIERSVLSRMSDILPWFSRILAAKEKHNEGMRKLIKRVKEELARQT